MLYPIELGVPGISYLRGGNFSDFGCHGNPGVQNHFLAGVSQESRWKIWVWRGRAWDW